MLRCEDAMLCMPSVLLLPEAASAQPMLLQASTVQQGDSSNGLFVSVGHCGELVGINFLAVCTLDAEHRNVNMD